MRQSSANTALYSQLLGRDSSPRFIAIVQHPRQVVSSSERGQRCSFFAGAEVASAEVVAAANVEFAAAAGRFRAEAACGSSLSRTVGISLSARKMRTWVPSIATAADRRKTAASASALPATAALAENLSCWLAASLHHRRRQR